MQLDIKKYLFDIKVSISSIENFLESNTDFNSYKSNKLLRRAVERELEIIGEAINRILKKDTTIQISNARKIVDLRNWVIHAYDSVDDIIIWGIVTNHLPKLKFEVENMLENNG